MCLISPIIESFGNSGMNWVCSACSLLLVWDLVFSSVKNISLIVHLIDTTHHSVAVFSYLPFLWRVVLFKYPQSYLSVISAGNKSSCRWPRYHLIPSSLIFYSPKLVPHTRRAAQFLRLFISADTFVSFLYLNDDGLEIAFFVVQRLFFLITFEIISIVLLKPKVPVINLISISFSFLCRSSSQKSL